MNVESVPPTPAGGMSQAVGSGPDAAAGSAADADPGPVVVSSVGGVRTVRLNRPAALNALDLPTKDAFLRALTDAAADDDVRAVVLTGTGRAFCAGQDLRDHQRLMEAADPRVAGTVSDFYNPAVRAIAEMAKPVVAAVNGVAAGAGAGLACACDLRVAGRGASFTMAFAGVALSADSGLSWFLPRLIGAGRASRMLLLGDRVDAAEALGIGLVDEVFDDDELDQRVAQLARRLADGPTRAYGWIKASLRHAATADLGSALGFEERAQAELFSGADHREALSAFVDRRAPDFRGR